MDKIENPLGMLRQLKGAPLSVLLALYLAGQPVTEEWLSNITGYTEKVIRKAAHYLLEMQLAGRNQRFSGWVCMKDAFQMPLMNTEENDRYKLPVELPTTTTVNRRSNEFVLERSSSKEESTGKNYRSLSIYEKNMVNLLHLANIGDPKAFELVKLQHVTLMYLISHIDAGVRKNTDTALIIHKIASNDRRPMSCAEYEAYQVNGNVDAALAELEALEGRARRELIDWHAWVKGEDDG